MNPALLIAERYHGATVTFRDADAWVNATQMAKPFGKRPKEFLRTDAAKAFVAALQHDLSKGQISPLPVYTAQHGGECPGTWMHPDLALEFARWLSPEFAIWTNRVIRKLMSGQAVVAPQLTYAESLRQLASTVERNERLAAGLKILHARVQFGSPSPKTGEPRTRLVPAYFRSGVNPDKKTRHFLTLQLNLELPFFITGNGNGIAIGDGNTIQAHPNAGGAK